MKVKKVILLCVITVFWGLSCSIPVEKTKTTVISTKENCSIITSETAILIAKGYLFLDYDLHNREVKAETEVEMWKDKGEMWKISLFSKENRKASDEAIVVWVLKTNGEIFTVKHQK